jgi:hypothetical protein
MTLLYNPGMLGCWANKKGGKASWLQMKSDKAIFNLLYGRTISSLRFISLLECSNLLTRLWKSVQAAVVSPAFSRFAEELPLANPTGRQGMADPQGTPSSLLSGTAARPNQNTKQPSPIPFLRLRGIRSALAYWRRQ